MKPLVSVMMPAYNAAQFIGKAIESMQAQTYKNWELVIVDDGSTDLTGMVVGTFLDDERIKFDSIPHGGCPVARNRCLELMTGDIYARLDADDVHSPERLELQVQYLIYHKDVDIVSCGMTWLRGGVKLPKPNVKGMNPEGYMNGTANGPCCASLVAWSSVYDEVGGYESHMQAGSDGDWNFRAIIAEMQWGHIDKMMYHQRRHGDQISQALRAAQRKTHVTSREKYRKLWKTK